MSAPTTPNTSSRGELAAAAEAEKAAAAAAAEAEKLKDTGSGEGLEGTNGSEGGRNTTKINNYTPKAPADRQPRVAAKSYSFLGGQGITVAYIVGAVIAVAIATIGTLHLLNVLNFMPAAIPTMAVIGATAGAPALALLTGVALALLNRHYQRQANL